MIFGRVTACIASTFDVPTEAHKGVGTILWNRDIAVLQCLLEEASADAFLTFTF
jgi:hypothetical protein